MSYAWANNLVYRVTGSPVPIRGAFGSASGSPGRAAARVAAGSARADIPIDWDRLVAARADQLPTWGTMAMRTGPTPGGAVSITLRDAANWNAFARSTLTLDSVAGDVLEWHPYSGSTPGQQLRGWIRFTHTASWAGQSASWWPDRCVRAAWCWVWTGLILALRRRAAWRRAAPRQRSQAA